MKIGDREIGPGNPVLIVAELSGSHLGSLKNAHRLIDYAAGAGASAIKLQMYEPSDFTAPDAPPLPDGPWKGIRPWDLYTKSQTPRDWHAALFDHARNRGMLAFSTPFSPDAVEFLETLDCPAYKVASLESDYIPLLRTIEATGKPMLVSTGATDDSGSMMCAIQDNRSYRPRHPVVLMHCVAAYPTPIDRANLMRFQQLGIHAVTTPMLCSTGYTPQEEDFWPLGGLSDHSCGTLVPVLAVALGARVIEKHIKLYEDHDDPDAGFAETPARFAEMVKQVRLAEEALAARDNTELEAPMRALRRREIDGRWLRVAP